MKVSELKRIIKEVIEESIIDNCSVLTEEDYEKASCSKCKHYAKMEKARDKHGCLEYYDLRKQYNIRADMDWEIKKNETDNTDIIGKRSIRGSIPWSTWIRRKKGVDCKFFERKLKEESKIKNNDPANLLGKYFDKDHKVRLVDNRRQRPSESTLIKAKFKIVQYDANDDLYWSKLVDDYGAYEKFESEGWTAENIWDINHNSHGSHIIGQNSLLSMFPYKATWTGNVKWVEESIQYDLSPLVTRLYKEIDHRITNGVPCIISCRGAADTFRILYTKRTGTYQYEVMDYTEYNNNGSNYTRSYDMLEDAIDVVITRFRDDTNKNIDDLGFDIRVSWKDW